MGGARSVFGGAVPRAGGLLGATVILLSRASPSARRCGRRGATSAFATRSVRPITDYPRTYLDAGIHTKEEEEEE